MKKIILLLLIPSVISGCYDYNQLNDLAIISGIGIDYENHEFKVTFEVISTKKEGETSGSNSTYYITSSGENIVYAFTEAANKIDKVLYFEHVEVVVFSENVAKEHLNDCIDYLIRTEKLRNEFYAAITRDSAEDLISASTKEHPIVSSYLVQLLEFNSQTYNSAYYIHFTKTINSMLSEGEDAMLPIFKINEDDAIELDGLGIFKDFELVHSFNSEDASIVNLLNNFNVESVHFNKSCGDNQNVIIAAYKSDVSIEPSNDKISVKATINARISESTCDYDFKNAETYLELENEFAQVIANEMDKVLKQFQVYKSNALSIGRSYYNKYRKKDFYLWTTQDIEYEINLKINKKGLTFEVET